MNLNRFYRVPFKSDETGNDCHTNATIKIELLPWIHWLVSRGNMNSEPIYLSEFQDFGDGGAFPEIHVAQYPLSMGVKKSASNALAVQLDASGKIKYDAIAKVGHSKDKVIHSKFQDLVPKVMDEDDPELQRPDDDELADVSFLFWLK